MPLVEFLKEFGSDIELIGRDRKMSAGLARAHAGQARGAETADTRSSPRDGSGDRGPARRRTFCPSERPPRRHGTLSSSGRILLPYRKPLTVC